MSAAEQAIREQVGDAMTAAKVVGVPGADGRIPTVSDDQAAAIPALAAVRR